MKTFAFAILLTFSLTNILHAGLDTDSIFNHVVAIYHFESTETTDEGTVYTEDSGPQELPGSLLEGASLANGGKTGKCLSLIGDDAFGTGTRIFPHLAAVLTKLDSLKLGSLPMRSKVSTMTDLPISLKQCRSHLKTD